MDYSILLADLEGLLGKGQRRAKDNYAFRCPFCNHRKYKLEVQMVVSEKGENPWQCWVCLQKGKTIRSLLHQLQAPREQADSILSRLPKGAQGSYHEAAPLLQLPLEFKTLSEDTPLTRIPRNFLFKRKLTEFDIQKYNIGYCDTGEYGGRIIIPSYDDNGRLNYFLARTHTGGYPSYKNPPVSKNVIIFEDTINWNVPIILVEGIFDAMAIKRNCIPILGKNVPPLLMERINEKRVEDIYVALDGDARKRALQLSEQFLSMGKRVFLVELEDRDPSDLGFQEITEILSQAKELNLTSLLRLKLNL